MSEGLHGPLPPEALAALNSLQLTDHESSDNNSEADRVSLKDRPYVDLLHQHPELAASITNTMNQLADDGLEVPVFHITSRAVKLADGTEQSTGYLEGIALTGLRARDTNVAALVERGSSTHIASPDYFAVQPHKLLWAMGESLSHYSHHGSRTNKESLGTMREVGVGTPTMLVIDATNVELIPGTDYDDHFILGEPIPASHIMGHVDLAGRKPIHPEDVAAVTYDFLDTIHEHQESRELATSTQY